MKILKSAFVIIGAIIGAGFASGKEIFEYFAKFGKYSFLMIIPLFFLFYFVIKIYLKFGSKIKVFSLKKENNNLIKKIKIKNLEINYLNIFMFLTFLILCSAMFSGLFSLITTYFPNLNKTLIYFLIIALSFILAKISFNFLSSFSYFVVPLIIICIINISFSSIGSINLDITFETVNYSLMPILSNLYVFQNTFLSSFAIVNSGVNLSKKEQTGVAIIVSGTLCLLIFMGVVCFLCNPDVSTLDIPFAQIAIAISPYFSAIFGIMVMLSILTTYITTLSSLKEYFTCEKKYNKQYIMILLIALLSLFDFGTIIEYLYPIIGVFGAIYCYKIANILMVKKEFKWK